MIIEEDSRADIALVGGSSTGPVCLYLLGGAVTSSTWLLELLSHSQTAARLTTASCAGSAVKLLPATGSTPERVRAAEGLQSSFERGAGRGAGRATGAGRAGKPANNN